MRDARDDNAREFKRIPETLRDEMIASLAAATTEAELRELWREWIGYIPPDDCNVDGLRGDLADYVRELCYAAGIDCPASLP
jgi:hypothetical protein